MGFTDGFQLPLKESHNLFKDKYWFLNWQKPLQLKPDQFLLLIDSWWNGFPSSANAIIGDKVKIKQDKSKQFGEYCYRLHEATKLVWNAGLIDGFDIGKVLSEQ